MFPQTYGALDQNQFTIISALPAAFSPNVSTKAAGAVGGSSLPGVVTLFAPGISGAIIEMGGGMGGSLGG